MTGRCKQVHRNRVDAVRRRLIRAEKELLDAQASAAGVAGFGSTLTARKRVEHWQAVANDASAALDDLA